MSDYVRPASLLPGRPVKIVPERFSATSGPGATPVSLIAPNRRCVAVALLAADLLDIIGGERESDRIARGLDDRTVRGLADILSPEEDSELRRLNYMSKAGYLSERSRERIIELRLRDRRREIREPREFTTEEPPPAQPGGIRRLLRMGRSERS